MAVRAAFPYAHITVSPVPAPRRSATTTTFFVGCLSRSYGCTIRKRTPSRSGVFLVDHTVPMTLPRNIGVSSISLQTRFRSYKTLRVQVFDRNEPLADDI